MARRWAAALVLLAGSVVMGDTAVAGGGWLAPVKDRYEPGEVATLVGYTGDPVLRAVPEEPFYAYLRPASSTSGARLLASDVYVGELVVEETARRGYLRFRVSVTFDVPDYLPAGQYTLTYCDDPCTGRFLGDLVPSPLSVGVDPLRPIARDWPADDPEVANLAPGTVLVGPAGPAATANATPTPPPAPAIAAPPTTPPVPAAVPVAVGPVESPDMAWPLPTALVVTSAAGTGLVLSRRQRRLAATGAPGRWVVPGGRTRPGAASAGPG